MKHERIDDRHPSTWIRRHLCRSARRFAHDALKSGAGRVLPHLVADAFVRATLQDMGYAETLWSGLSNDAGLPCYDPCQTAPEMRRTAEIERDGSPVFEYVMVLHGMPICGSRITVTLLGSKPSLVDASMRLPLILPHGPMPRPEGMFLPRMIDGLTLSQLFTLEKPVEIVSKRLVLHSVEPHRIGGTGRLETPRGFPLLSRRPLPRRNRTGAFCYTSEIVFDIRCRDGQTDRWRVLLDAASGALAHAERCGRDILNNEDVSHARNSGSADRIPSPFALEVADLGGAVAVAGQGGWAAILKASALHAAQSVPNFRRPGSAV